MQISQILSLKGNFVATIAPHASVRAALEELSEFNIGALIVSDDGQKIQGICSERDIVRALHRRGERVLDEEVGSIMSKEVTTCAPEDLVDTLMATMTEHRVRHLPVVERGLLTGLVSIGDIVKSRVDELEKDRDALVDFIHAR